MRPLVCLNETNKPLAGEAIRPIFAAPGQTERYGYAHNGLVNLLT